MYPLSDEFMTYDYDTHRYVLTEKDVFDNLGINISARIKNPTAINALLDQISGQVYDFLHDYNFDNNYQDFIIAATESGRKIIKRAMEEQLKYVLTVGDLTRSTDEKKRALWFDMSAKRELLKPIKEIGCSILYTGHMPRFFNEGVRW